MQKLIITTNSCSSTILITKDGQIITALPLDNENLLRVEKAYEDPALVNNWEPNWDNDGRNVDEHGEIVMKIYGNGKKSGDLEKVRELAQLG